MNKFLKKDYLPILSLAAGVLALALQGLLFLLFRDEKGLLPKASFLHILAWLIIVAALVVWSHRSNIVRLVKGNENKFKWHKDPPEEK